MKVLYLYMFPLWGNGSGTWIRKQILQLNKKYGNSFQAAIIAPEKREFEGAKMYHLTPPNVGVFVGNPELPKVKKYADMPNTDHYANFHYYLIETAKAVEEFKPDLIHVFHTAFLPPIASFIYQFYKIPYVISTHGSDLYYFKEDPRWVNLVKDASREAKSITANSNFTRDWYLEMFGHDLKNSMRMIPGGIDNNVEFSRDVSWIDEKYRLTTGNMVLFTGRLTEHKGVEYLIRAAKHIKADIVIIGDGPERQKLEALVKKLKLNNVHLLGYFSQQHGKIDDFYLRADVYVAPSVWDEPLGLVILEAMIHKTPVVVTKNGGVTTVVKDNTNGFLIRRKSAPAIAEQVNKLLKDDKLRKKMSETAYKTVVDRFSWDRIADKFYNAYEKAIEVKKVAKHAPDSLILTAFKRFLEMRNDVVDTFPEGS